MGSILTFETISKTLYKLSGNFYLCIKKNMKIPPYLIADNSSLEEDVFVIHTDFPRFILNVATDEIEWLDSFSQQEAEENADAIEEAVKKAYEFFDEEMKNYE